MKAKKLVIDTSAFIKSLSIWELGDEFYCTADVIKEVKDRQTRHHIDALPFQLQLREPSPSSIKFINDFTKKTGDFASLSLADVKILALTYELEVESKRGSSHLRTEPIDRRTEVVASQKPPLDSVLNDLEGFYISHKKYNKNSLVHSSQTLTESLCDSPIGDDTKVEDVLEEVDFCGLNEHLSIYPYVGGYCMTQKDVLTMEKLQMEDLLLGKLSNIGAYHKRSSNWHLFREVCLKQTDEVWQSEDEPGAEEGECESLRVAKLFVQKFSHWPHFVRWLLHMMTFDEDELRSINVQDKGVDNSQSECEQHPNCEEMTDDRGSLNMNPETVSLNEVPSCPESLLRLEDEELDENCDTGTENASETALEDDSGSEPSDSGCEASEDDDDGWITPSNINSFRNKKNKAGDVSQEVEVACITGDFSMQNTLRHIGLEVMGVDGKIIQNVRTFILRCFACYKTTNNMGKVFCPHCGHKTLKKVSVTLNPDGTQKIWISSKKPINTRGTKFSLPRPKGGKHAINPILVADQREVRQAVSKLGQMKTNPLDDDYVARSGVSPFVTRDIYSRSAQLGIRSGSKQHRGMFYWEQKNPNVPLKKSTRKKKR